MNKPNRWIIAPVFLLAVMAATFGLADDDSLWEVTEVETGTDPEMIMTEDTFRLQFTGNDKMVHLKPLPRLRGRWGQTDNFTARLQRQSAGLYCGEFQYRGKGHENDENHHIALSVIDPGYVVLQFDGACTYYETHGGTAHAHR